MAIGLNPAPLTSNEAVSPAREDAVAGATTTVCGPEARLPSATVFRPPAVTEKASSTAWPSTLTTKLTAIPAGTPLVPTTRRGVPAVTAPSGGLSITRPCPAWARATPGTARTARIIGYRTAEARLTGQSYDARPRPAGQGEPRTRSPHRITLPGRC